MKILPKVCEEILKFCIDNRNVAGCVDLKDVKHHFSHLEHRKILDSIYFLEENGYVKIFITDMEEVGSLSPLPEGIFYFDNKETNPPVSSQQFNFNNSTIGNIGNNNTASFQIGSSFDEAYRLVSELNISQQELMRDFLDTLKDCLENSKPLPQSKFQKISKIIGNITPFFSFVGQIIMQYMGMTS